MPVQTPRASMPLDLTAAAKRAWYSFKAIHPSTAEDPLLAGISMYQRGYRDAFLAGAEMAGLRPILQRWVELLEDARVEDDLASLGQDQ